MEIEPVDSHPSETQVERYRRLAAEHASGVGVVCSRYRGKDHAITVTAFADVSYDPPTMLVCLYDMGRMCEAVAASGSWTLSLLSAGQRSVANWLASPGNPVDGLLDSVPFHRTERSGTPVLDGCLSWFELDTVSTHTAATHLVVVGRVTAMGRGEGTAATSRPLVHYAREYKSIG
ncbi:oxidoreductase [Kocuria tytonicola]|uniref:Flavin reductase n=1 Tax=Kocuria tytonicola TaxID=2055946 RepID=A0A3L9LV51_9MICC|nr:flavin reductase family protein [Kocuria tytonicola]RLY91562.1 flavin reductase [Kocuria tytonicola]RLZ03021.1 oxidoreductase [Kocuria tytonicola]